MNARSCMKPLAVIGCGARDPIQEEELRERLHGSMFGERLVLLPRVGSTNSVAKEMAARGEPEGVVVVAEEQTQGRGRRGRLWISPGYTNLLFSVLLRPGLDVEGMFSVTMAMGLAVAETLECWSGVHVGVKWPNDLFVAGKKLGGMLSEFAVHGRSVTYMVVGVGVNVNWRISESTELGPWATSLLEESGRLWPRGILLADLLKGFEREYGRVLDARSEEVYRRWRQRLIMKGQDVEIRSQGDRIQGTLLDVEADGALRLRDHKGGHRRILCGEISLRAL